jgi:hypothetical protein
LPQIISATIGFSRSSGAPTLPAPSLSIAYPLSTRRGNAAPFRRPSRPRGQTAF